jgi:hypothetical protein
LVSEAVRKLLSIADGVGKTPGQQATKSEDLPMGPGMECQRINVRKLGIEKALA